jgi:hypothetical protein
MKDRLLRPDAAEALVGAKRLRPERSKPNRESRRERAATARLLVQTQRLLHTDRETDV